MRNNLLVEFALATILVIAFNGACIAASPMVSMGDKHTVALRSDGTVVSWGSDEHGRLGIGREIFATTPAVVPQLTGVQAIGSGWAHSIAIRQDGSVWTWGSNSSGQLGDGTTVDRPSPVQVSGIDNASVACGGNAHSIVAKRDGTVWAWGSSAGSASIVPVLVAGLASITKIACVDDHNLALRQDGTVWAWGANYGGQIGDGTTVMREQAVQVAGLSDVIAIGAGQGVSAALKQDGTVWVWGYDNSVGKSNLYPAQVIGISNAIALRVDNGGFIAAIAADGSTWWNWRAGTVPVAANSVGSLESVVPGNTTLLLKSDRTVWSYGTNDSGQAGDGTTTYRSAIGAVLGLANIVALSAGSAHAIALDAGGSVWAWGSNSTGQLGRGGVVNRSIPVEVSGLANIVQVSAGPDFSLAVDQSGNVWSWGNNWFGVLGDGTKTPRSTPTLVSALTNVQAVAAGFTHSLALKRDGTVWAWGGNYGGVLGDGTNSERDTPIQVPAIGNIVAIAARSQSLAVEQGGTVWAWGDNRYGQLGLGTVTPLPTDGTFPTANNRPARIPGLTGVKSVATSWFSSYAVMTDGTVFAWGDITPWMGSDSPKQSSPALVTGLNGVAEIAAGYVQTLARKADGSVLVWGAISAESLGSSPGALSVPTPVAGVGIVQQISAGNAAESANVLSGLVRQDGFVYMGGRNNIGQLGDGTFAQNRYPVLAVNSSANGFLNLNPGTVFEVPPALAVPFFVVSVGGITDTNASINTTTKFNKPDEGKAGAVYVTARAASGAMRALSAGAASTGGAGGTYGAWSALSAADSYDLLQLTPTGWQAVVNGQLIPYASGVIGDQLAAQKILDGTDTTNLKGAQFCVGYGTSAEEMTAAARMRVVATIPDPSAIGVPATSCIVAGGATPLSFSLSLPPGWNLVGNSLDQTLSTASLYGDVNTVTSVWKWDIVTSGWQFYTPLMDAASLQAYAASKGYGVLSTINPGEGYWVNVKTQPAPANHSGAPFNLTASNLANGWNLVATGNDITPTAFNQSMGATPLTSLWAWDNPLSKWYFYAPSLEAQGATALSGYIASKGYLDFGSSSKTLGNGIGFWVNR